MGGGNASSSLPRAENKIHWNEAKVNAEPSNRLCPGGCVNLHLTVTYVTYEKLAQPTCKGSI